jgi:hypothetical protein
MGSKRFIALLIFASLPALLFGSRPTSAIAQAGGWAAPTEVSGTTTSSWFPDIAVDADAGVHIIWASGVAHGEEQQNQVDLLLYRSLKHGQWSKTNDIVNPGTGGFASRGSLTTGRDGMLHLLVRSQLRIDYLHAPWDDAETVRSWSEARRINNQRTVYYDALAADSTGSLHAFWNESMLEDPKKPSKECPGCSDLFYRRTSDGGKTWSSPINLSQSPDGSAKPQVKIGKDNEIHVVWDEGRDTIVGKGDPIATMYRRSRDGGVTWDSPVRFTLPPYTPPKTGEEQPEPKPDAPQQIALGLFQNQTPIVVYRSTAGDGLFYQVSEDKGATWSKQTRLPGVVSRDLNDTPWDAYTMATDGAGNVHLIVVGSLPGDGDPSLQLPPSDQRNRPRLLHLVWNGQAWSAPEVVATESRYPGWSASVMAKCDTIDPYSAQARTDAAKAALSACRDIERYPEWPRAVIGAGNQLHLTWFTRTASDLHDSDHSKYQVWYSVKQLDAPAIAPLPLFTPVPTALPQVATATPVPPTATPLPASILNAPLVDGSAAWEGPGIAMMALAALPAIGLLGLIVGMRALWVRRRRRFSG